MDIKIEDKPWTSHGDRPTLLGDLIGNRTVKKRLMEAAARGRLPNIMLLTGPTGSGKTTGARAIGRRKSCTGAQPGDAEACGQCKACQCIYDDFRGNNSLYEEIDAGLLTAERLLDLRGTLLVPRYILVLDELQDMELSLMKQLRKVVEGTEGTIIMTTTHPDSIDDALMNRLKLYHYALERPTPTEIVEDYLIPQFQRLGIKYHCRDQLLRVVEALHCEMRPIAQFGKQVLAETTDGVLTDEYMTMRFGSLTPDREYRRRRRAI